MKFLLLCVAIFFLIDVQTAVVHSQNILIYILKTPVVQKRPTFCKHYDCPSYKLIQKNSDYEIREYSPSKWVETSVTSRNMNEATREMFMKLFNYISGNNMKNMKINMTVPVVTYMPDTKSLMDFFLANKTYSMAFYLPKEAPKPKCESVRIVEYPKTTYYVREFGGYVLSEKQVMTEYLKLSKKIGYRGKGFDFASYDSPMQIFKRHNEIWVEKKK